MNLSASLPTRQELLTQQFYDWELWGRGWPVWECPVALEPPFRPFPGHFVPRDYYEDDGLVEPGLTRFARVVKGLVFGAGNVLPGGPSEPAIEEVMPDVAEPNNELVELQVALPANAQPASDVFAQCLFSLSYCGSPLAFEVVGDRDSLTAQIVTDSSDGEMVQTQLKSHFPDAVITRHRDFLQALWPSDGTGIPVILEFGLNKEFMIPLANADTMAIDPMVAMCGALEQMEAGEIGVFQVLFQPVCHPWSLSAWRAVTTNDGKPFFENDSELVRLTRQKLGRPLFAVVVRTAARGQGEARSWELTRRLAGALQQFNHPEGNELVPLRNESYPDDDHVFDLVHRCSRRSGMLLNSDELVSLAHLPTAAVRSRKLKRQASRTKSSPAIASGEGILLGENIHEGTVMPVTLKLGQRVKHMHVIGASGTGKSTLLLNLICQDIQRGHGIGVFDPHGDLVDKVLSYIPPERHQDVILFDAADEAYPVGFNILSAHSNLEKDLLASDLVAVFRRLSTSWGDQMTSVMGNAVLAFLESSRGGTLADLRRFLVEPTYRQEFLGTVQDPEVVYYWHREFPLLKSANSVGPLLTRLNTFLRPKPIRYIVGQHATKLDFGAIMDKGKIFLAKLSQGLIGQENTSLLGALLVAKFHQLAISRQEQEASERKPFFIYMDEFQEFATPSMATILSGARKYQLGLILAHHNLRQLQRTEDLASAILLHPYTRVCFSLGDEDARKLADGFSFFEPRDLQNLGTGEAVCRMERADFDFNLRTVMPPEVDRDTAQQRRAHLQHLTRCRYGRPREEVEKELAASRAGFEQERVDPFAKRSAKADQNSKSEPKTPPIVTENKSPPDAEPPPKPGGISGPASGITADRDSKQAETETVLQDDSHLPEHRALQERIGREATGLGYSAELEDEVFGGLGKVDVALERGQRSIGCEVSFKTSAEHETANVRKCLEAGFGHVAVVCIERARLSEIQRNIAHVLSPEQVLKVGFYLPPEFIGLLNTWAFEDPEGGEAESRKRKKRDISLSDADLPPEKRRQIEKERLARMSARMKERKGGTV